MKALMARLGMDGRYRKIVAEAFRVPFVSMAFIGLIAVLLLDIPLASAAEVFVRICLWLAATIAIGAALWPLIVAVLLHGGARLRESSCVAATVLSLCPLLSYFVAGDWLFAFLGFGGLVYMLFIFQVCLVCFITQMAWRMYKYAAETRPAQ